MKTLSLLFAGALLLVSGTALAKGKGKGGGKAADAKLVLKVAPPDTEVWIDGQKKGTADKVKEINLSAGAHIVNLKHKGDEHEDQVILKKGVKTTFEWKFEDDRPKNDDSAGSGNIENPGDTQAPVDAPATPPSTP